jgi:hypothetical protein
VTTGVREHLLALVLAARADVRAARCDLGATPPPLARVPDTQQAHPSTTTTQPMLRLVVTTATARRA